MKLHFVPASTLILGLVLLASPKPFAAAQPTPTSNEFHGTMADLPSEAQSSIKNQLAKLAASVGQPGAFFGMSVAMSGNTVVVGAPWSNVGGNTAQGAAYVFVKPSSGWTNMTETAQLSASDATADYFFGLAVAISGNTIVVEGSYGGAIGATAYVYVKPSTGWTNMTESAKLSSPANFLGGGSAPSLAISGNTIVLGVPWGSIRGQFSGAAYIFVEPTGGWTNLSAPTAQLTTSTPGLYLGSSVAISGNTVVVSGTASSAFLYVKPAKNGWFGTRTETAALSASNGDPFDRVAISGNTVAAGSPGATIGSNAGQGAVYVFVEPSSGWASMTETAKLTSSNGSANDGLGDSVAIGANGDEIAAGAANANSETGAVYTFVKPPSGWANATQHAEFAASDGVTGSDLGDSISMSGIQFVTGAPQFNNSQPGAAYVFSAPQ